MKKGLLICLALLIGGCSGSMANRSAATPTDDSETVEVTKATLEATQVPATPTEAAAETEEAAVDDEAETAPAESTALGHAEMLDHVLFASNYEEAEATLTDIRESGDTRFVAGLIDTLRYQRSLTDDIGFTLNTLTGESLPPDWFEWVEWAGQHPEIDSFEDYPGWKANLFAQIDPNFLRFVHEGMQVDPNSRVEEIVWGGVRADGIPALDNPTMVDPAEVDYLISEERIFGVSINGDTRAYPARFLDWHEMFNDVVGGEPVSLAY